MSISIKKHLIVLVGYSLLAILMSLPLVFYLNSHVVGVGGDPWQTMWRFEQKASELVSAESFLATEFFGGGEARLVNISVWPWMWLYLIFGMPVAYNLVWLLSFVLSGYGVYLLVGYLLSKNEFEVFEDKGELQDERSFKLKVLVREAPAFLAGVLYAFSPFHVAHAQGHFGAMQMQWLPLILLAFLVWFKKPAYFYSVVLVILITLQAWSEHHYLVWLAIFFLVFAIVRRSKVKAFLTSRRGVTWTLAVVLMLIVSVVMPYWPTVRLAASGDSGLDLGDDQLKRFSADVFAYIVPASFHPIWGALSHTLFAQWFTGNVAEATHFIGIASILLLLFFHQQIPKQQKSLWITVVAVFWLISLGPRLHLLGAVLPIPLPYDLFDSWPILSAIRTVARAGVFVVLSVAVLVGWVLATNLKRMFSVVMVLTVILLEFLFLPVQLQSMDLPESYSDLGELPGKAIIEIPAGTNYTAASRSLYASLRHNKEVIGNIALERALDADEFNEARSLPGVRQLIYLRTTHLLEDREEFFAQDLEKTLPQALKWLEVGAIVIHPDSLSAIQADAVKHLLEGRLGLAPQIEDDLLIYSTAEYLEEDFGNGVFLARDGGWENVGYDPERDSVFAEVSEQAKLSLYNAADEAVLVQLNWEVPGESEGELTMSSEVEFNDHVHDIRLVRTIQIQLEPGQSDLLFRHTGAGKSIIQNPRLRVLGLGQ